MKLTSKIENIKYVKLGSIRLLMKILTKVIVENEKEKDETCISLALGESSEPRFTATFASATFVDVGFVGVGVE